MLPVFLVLSRFVRKKYVARRKKTLLEQFKKKKLEFAAKSVPIGRPCDEMELDLEITPVKRQIPVPEAVHGMEPYDDDEEEAWPMVQGDDEDSDDFNLGDDDDALQWTESWMKGALDVKGLLIMESIEKKNSEVMPLQGNIYRSWSLGLYPPSFLSRAGMVFIAAIQLLAPLVIMIYAAKSIDWDHLYSDFFLKSEDYRRLDVIEYWMTRLLALLFIFAVWFWGDNTLHEEGTQWSKFRFLVSSADSILDKPNVKPCLYLDPFMNVYVMVLSFLDLALLFSISDSPVDVVYDALGLSFLISLDDVGGDLAFLVDTWDEDRVGQLFETILFTRAKKCDPKAYSEWELEATSRAKAKADLLKRSSGYSRCYLYIMGRIALGIIAFGAVFLLFSNARPKAEREDADKYWVEHESTVAKQAQNNTLALELLQNTTLALQKELAKLR